MTLPIYLPRINPTRQRLKVLSILQRSMWLPLILAMNWPAEFLTSLFTCIFRKLFQNFDLDRLRRHSYLQMNYNYALAWLCHCIRAGRVCNRRTLANHHMKGMSARTYIMHQHQCRCGKYHSQERLLALLSRYYLIIVTTTASATTTTAATNNTRPCCYFYCFL